MFKKCSMISLPVVLALTLGACNQQASTPIGRPMAIDSDTVATVNGVKLTQAELDEVKQIRQMNHQPADTQNSLDDLISMELLRQKAVADKTYEDPKVAQEINRQATNALISAYIQQMMENQPISDDELQKAYDERIGTHPRKEYKARHILSKTEKEAAANIEALKKGADFTKLAKEKSIEPGASTSGGDLGWQSPNTFVPEFSKAMETLKPGEYSQKPVQTQFGWHVILLEDVRDAQHPSLESVKPQLQRMLANQKLMDMINNLRENAKIETMVNDGTSMQGGEQPPAGNGETSTGTESPNP